MLVTAKETCFYGGKLRFKGDSFEFEDLPVCMIKIEAEVEATPKSKKKV